MSHERKVRLGWDGAHGSVQRGPDSWATAAPRCGGRVGTATSFETASKKPWGPRKEDANLEGELRSLCACSSVWGKVKFFFIY